MLCDLLFVVVGFCVGRVGGDDGWVLESCLCCGCVSGWADWI